MSFIRAKEIPPRSGNWYDYEVETIHKGGKVIQKHIRYIGKSTRLSSRSSRSDMGIGSYPIATTPMPIISVDDARIYKMKTPAKLDSLSYGNVLRGYVA